MNNHQRVDFRSYTGYRISMYRKKQEHSNVQVYEQLDNPCRNNEYNRNISEAYFYLFRLEAIGFLFLLLSFTESMSLILISPVSTRSTWTWGSKTSGGQLRMGDDASCFSLIASSANRGPENKVSLTALSCRQCKYTSLSSILSAKSEAMVELSPSLPSTLSG